MDNQLKKNIGKRIVGTLAIPLIVAAILMTICALGARRMIDSALGLYVYICNMQNASNNTTLRLNWNVTFGLGDDAPWLTSEIPVMMISTAYPYHLFDAPMIETYINAYSSESIFNEAVMEKIMGRSEFKGISPCDPFCGKDYI